MNNCELFTIDSNIKQFLVYHIYLISIDDTNNLYFCMFVNIYRSARNT